MIRDRSFVKEMVRIYDKLIFIGKQNIGKSVSMDFGTWTPSQRGIDTIKSRRDKIYYGKQ